MGKLRRILADEGLVSKEGSAGPRDLVKKLERFLDRHQPFTLDEVTGDTILIDVMYPSWDGGLDHWVLKLGYTGDFELDTPTYYLTEGKLYSDITLTHTLKSWRGNDLGYGLEDDLKDIFKDTERER